jgi:hypothetical protein
MTEVPKITKTKRDIYRFEGSRPTAINLEHVTTISVEGIRITFGFHYHSIFVDCDSVEIAKDIFEQFLKVWACDVVE